MRHRIGVVLAIVMTGVLFFGGAWGYLRLLRYPAPLDQFSQLPAHGGSLLSNHSVLTALAAVVGTGLLAGILISVPWISPLATGLPGLLALGWTGLYLVSVRQAVDLIPLRSDPFGAGFEAMLINGVLTAAGVAMIIPMFLPSRWRSRTDEPSGFIPALDMTAEKRTDKLPEKRTETLPEKPRRPPWEETAPAETGVRTGSATTRSTPLRLSSGSPPSDRS